MPYRRPKLYHRWVKIKARCYSELNPDYVNYGARGIDMLTEWRDSYRSFENWIYDNIGEPPEGYTLDRIDNDLGYHPGNLRWASMRQQRYNQRCIKQRELGVHLIKTRETNNKDGHVSMLYWYGRKIRLATGVDKINCIIKAHIKLWELRDELLANVVQD